MKRTQDERTRILIGCEGESERGYAVHLGRRAQEKGKRVHVEAPVLKGGDALARLEWMQHYIEREEAIRTPFVHRFALLDTDQDRLSPDRTKRAHRLAEALQVTVIWQNPAHEGFLVRHFDGYTMHRPPLTADALALIARLWPRYAKGLPAMEYHRKLAEADVLRASTVEPDLLSLLIAIGLVEIVT